MRDVMMLQDAPILSISVRENTFSIRKFKRNFRNTLYNIFEKVLQL